MWPVKVAEDNINQQQKFYSLPKRQNKIRRFEQRSLIETSLFKTSNLVVKLLLLLNKNSYSYSRTIIMWSVYAAVTTTNKSIDTNSQRLAFSRNVFLLLYRFGSEQDFCCLLNYPLCIRKAILTCRFPSSLVCWGYSSLFFDCKGTQKHVCKSIKTIHKKNCKKIMSVRC